MTEKEVLEKFETYKSAIIKLKEKIKSKDELIQDTAKMLEEERNDFEHKICKLNERIENDTNVMLEHNKMFSELASEYNLFREKTKGTLKHLVEDVIEKQEETIESLKKVTSKELEYTDEISVLEQQIENLKNVIVEKDKIIKSKDLEIDKLNSTQEVEIPNEKQEEYFRYKFGRTTKTVMGKLLQFIDLLFENIVDQESIIYLNDPLECKEKLGLTKKEYEIFLSRLIGIKVNGKSLIEILDNKYIANFKDDWIKQYVSTITN